MNLIKGQEKEQQLAVENVKHKPMSCAKLYFVSIVLEEGFAFMGDSRSIKPFVEMHQIQRRKNLIKTLLFIHN